MFSTINFRNEKKQHQKSKEEHKRIFFHLKCFLQHTRLFFVYLFWRFGRGGGGRFMKQQRASPHL